MNKQLIHLILIPLLLACGSKTFPKNQKMVIRISTYSSGCNPAFVEKFITTPIERSLQEANIIEEIQSTSRQDTSDIFVEIKKGVSKEAAANEILRYIQKIRGNLPVEITLGPEVFFEPDI